MADAIQATESDLSSPERKSAGEPIIIGIALIASIALLWLAPPVGLIACGVMLVIAPPWGRGYAERAVISFVVLLGIAAIAFPRSSEVPINTYTAHVAMTIFTVVATGLRVFPPIAVRVGALTRPKITDVLLAVFTVATALWLMSAYLGSSASEIVSGLFFSGWDNQGHFVPFANTIEIGRTAWPTVDGSVAWNQWYPSLHTTVWALAELGSQWGTAVPSRIALLFPYVQWTAVSFAISLGALAWIASDLASRLTIIGLGRTSRRGRTVRKYAQPAAIVAFAAFALLGSPTVLFNFGFTNFMMGVAVTAVVAYGSARTWRSAQRVGWFLLPLGALAVIGLWTPLVIGLIPSGVVVLIALWRLRRPLAPIWAVLSVALIGGTVLLQSRAIVDAGAGSSGSFIEDLGAVGTGMSPFNLGAAIAAPFIAVLLAALVWRRGHTATATAIAGSSVGISVFVIIAMVGADAAGLSRLGSYYVLKSLNALLLVLAPMLAAVLAVGTVALIAVGMRWLASRDGGRLRRADAWIGAMLVGVVVITFFGYVGVVPTQYAGGFAGAPGIDAAAKRVGATQNSLIGEAIINGTQASLAYPNDTSLLWDGSGTLPNLWVAGLRGVLSTDQQRFYRNLPPFPYEEKGVQNLEFSLNTNPDQNFVLLWFRGVSGELMRGLVAKNPDRLVEQQVQMRSSILCQECSG